MTQTTFTHTDQIATDQNFEHSFEGYQLSDFTVKIASQAENLFLDGKTIISDKSLAIGTQNTNDSLFLGTVNSPHVELDHNGVLNLLSAKLSLGSGKLTGSAGQVLSTDGNGNLSWQTVDFTQFAVGSFAVSGQNTVSATTTSQQVTLAEGSGIEITTDASSKTITIANTGAAANAFKNFAVTASGGTSTGGRLYNHFINTTIGGETFGASTRVVRVTDESGTLSNLTMQAKSDGTCLLLPVTDENGSTSNIEIDMTE